MLFTRRSFLQATTKRFGGVVATTMLPTVGHAFAPGWANCSRGTQTVGFSQNSQTKVANFSDWRLGDCELQSASLTLHNNGVGAFNAQVCTHFTHSKDIWHFYVELAAVANSSTFITEFEWDGPQMSEQDRPLFHSWVVNFRFAPDAFNGIKFARATSCC